MVSDNDDVISPIHSNSNHNSELKSTNSQQHHSRTNKTTRSGLFTGSIFARVREQLDQNILILKGKNKRKSNLKLSISL